MDWVGTLRNWLIGPDMAGIAEQIAQRVRTEVWRRVEHRVRGLRLAEARGYVRVKTARVVREAVDQTVRSNAGIQPGRQIDLEHLVMEAVLRQAVLDLINARQLANETVVPLRKAA